MRTQISIFLAILAALALATGCGGDGDGDVDADADGGYGDCDMWLGYAFDNGRCRGFGGCSCDPDCGHFFETMQACAEGCAAEGRCDDTLMQGAGIAPAHFAVGDFCDEIIACFRPEAVMPDTIPALVPGATCVAPSTFCSVIGSCTLSDGGAVTEAQWQDFCELTMVDGVESVVCVVYGP